MDAIEEQAQRLGREQAERADLVLWCVEVDSMASGAARLVGIGPLTRLRSPFVVLTKCDLAAVDNRPSDDERQDRPGHRRPAATLVERGEGRPGPGPRPEPEPMPAPRREGPDAPADRPSRRPVRRTGRAVGPGTATRRSTRSARWSGRSTRTTCSTASSAGSASGSSPPVRIGAAHGARLCERSKRSATRRGVNRWFPAERLAAYSARKASLRARLRRIESARETPMNPARRLGHVRIGR